MNKIRYVDGFFIRSHLDPDFAVLHTSGLGIFAQKYYIPNGEIWIDKQFRREASFFLELEKLWNKKKMPYQKFREMLKKQVVKKGSKPNFIQSIEKKGR